MTYDHFINVLEAGAFFSAIYYYKNTKDLSAKYFCWFLGLTLLVEIAGYYTYFIGEDEFFSFVRETPFRKNYWMFNIYLLICMGFYASYFKWQLKGKRFIKTLNILLSLYLLLGITYFIVFKTFFNAYSPFSLIAGTIVVFISIAFYYLELINNNTIIIYRKNLPVFISVGILIWMLCTTPLFLYSIYFKSYNPQFIAVYKTIIPTANTLLYSFYIIVFLICAKDKK